MAGFIPPSSSTEDKKKQELLQQIIQKIVTVGDILAQTMVDQALGRTYASNSSSYDIALSQTTPESQPYKLSTPTLVDFVQKIVWPNTYIFDPNWTEPPNQEKDGGSMRGIGSNAGSKANTDVIFGTTIIGKAKQTSWFKNASPETKKVMDELEKLYAEFTKTFKQDVLAERKNIVYVLGGNDLIGSLFYTYFLCSGGSSGKAITLMANDPYMGYLYADMIWNSGPSSITSTDKDDLGELGISYQPTQEMYTSKKVDKTSYNNKLGSDPGTRTGQGAPTAETFAKSNVCTDIPFNIKIDSKEYSDAISASAKTDKIFKYAPLWLLARHRQIKALTSDPKTTKFDTFFKQIEERLGFVPFKMDTFKNQAIARLGIEGDRANVSNVSMLAIIGELLCLNSKGMFALNEYEKKFLAVKYAQYRTFELAVS